MLATSAAPFDNPAYLFETKWDGVRGMVAKADGRLRIWGRDGQDYTPRYPELSVLLDLPDGTVLDGELVLLRNGRPDFHALMTRHRRTPRSVPYFAEPVHYVVFDLLYLAGESLLDRPLLERLELRALLMASLVEGELAYVGAVELGIEGVRLSEIDWLARRRPVVPCGIKARWVEPRLLCVVRFAGWRPSGASAGPVPPVRA